MHREKSRENTSGDASGSKSTKIAVEIAKAIEVKRAERLLSRDDLLLNFRGPTTDSETQGNVMSEKEEERKSSEHY